MINKNMLKIDKSKKIEAYGIPVGFEGHVINNILSINIKKCYLFSQR